MFNLNDHPPACDKLEALWSFYARTDRWGSARTTSSASTSTATVVRRLQGHYPSWVIKDEDGNLLDKEIDATFLYRSTEVYKRDDGEGGKEWRMWHFHCSTRPEREIPPPKTAQDTSRARGLGNTPYGRARWSSSDRRPPADRLRSR